MSYLTNYHLTLYIPLQDGCTALDISVQTGNRGISSILKQHAAGKRYVSEKLFLFIVTVVVVCMNVTRVTYRCFSCHLRTCYIIVAVNCSAQDCQIEQAVSPRHCPACACNQPTVGFLLLASNPMKPFFT